MTFWEISGYSRHRDSFVLRTLLLGRVVNYPGVECHLWSRGEPPPNVSDFDLVVIDLTTFATGDPTSLPQPDHIARHLAGSSGLLVFVGDPKMTSDLGVGPALGLLPVFPEVLSNSTDKLPFVASDWAPYFGFVDEATFALRTPFTIATADFARYQRSLNPSAGDVGGLLFPIAQTRSELIVGGVLQIQMVMNDAGRYWKDLSKVVWLPPPTRDPDQAFDALLSVLLGDPGAPEAPQWTQDLALPREAHLCSELNEVTRRLDALLDQKVALEARLAEERRWVGLLYQQGTPLEALVREALTVLLADVREPTVPGKDDGRLVAPTGDQVTLEIKGTGGQIKLEWARQLDQWVGDADVDDDWVSIGLMFANTERELPPAQRRAPFPPNVIAFARRRGLRLATTAQIFAALVALQEGSLDVNGWWSGLLSTSGIADAPSLNVAAISDIETGGQDSSP